MFGDRRAQSAKSSYQLRSSVPSRPFLYDDNALAADDVLENSQSLLHRHGSGYFGNPCDVLSVIVFIAKPQSLLFSF
jgi:hypothetical protein